MAARVALRGRTSIAARPAARRSAGRRASAGIARADVEAKVPLGKYCESHHFSARRPTRTVMIGDVPCGSEHPIVKQTMVTTDTRDVDATVAEVIRCADAGADIVRVTVQGMMEAKACKEIRAELNKKGYSTPLVADIHFAPKVALLVAECFEKIRVNPGNFADGRKKFEELTYETPEEYQAELDFIEETFTPLVLKCKELGRAMRIGTNHGSLSARILSYYGDTPAGMVESAFEFARICRKHDFHNFVFSMKASNPLVMVQAYRLLVAEMYKLGWDYPVHLGVTEAGEGEDGRMKSAIGIGTLLLDGIGDTVRVSLTEAPELELAPCTTLCELGTEAVEQKWGVDAFDERRDFSSFEKRQGELPEQREGDAVDFRGLLHRDGSVVSAVSLAELSNPDLLYRKLGCKMAVGMPFKDVATSDSIYLPEVPPVDDETARTALRRLIESNVGVIADAAALAARPVPNAVALVPLADAAAPLPEGAGRRAIVLDGTETAEEISALAGADAVMALVRIKDGLSKVHASRRVMEAVQASGSTIPVLHWLRFGAGDSTDDLVIRAGSFGGSMLVDGLGDGVMLEGPQDLDYLRTTSFGLLQGSRMRNTKTEFVSCPSCGRTLFDLQEVTAAIASRTGHLPGVAIAIMGCIVNGPGEMADADFGYVGGAPGKIDLYVGKEVVQRNIPNDEACDALIQLIKDHGRWVEPEPKEEEELVASA